MKRGLFICFGSLALYAACGQSTAGITHIPDTSYSIRGEYAKHIKNYPGIRIVEEISSPDIREKKNIEYGNTGARKLLLDAFVPAGKPSQKRTAVIFIHGGGWRSGHRSMHYPLAQRLAEKGYACFTPEYRLSTEALYPAAIHDIKAAIRWVRMHARTYRVDPDRIVVAGHSAGGELAVFMGSTNGNPDFEGKGGHAGISSRVNAVIDIDGTLAFIHPESGEGDDSKKISAATNWFGYAKNENPALWTDAAPLSHVDSLSAPVLFINSSVDRMHAGRSDYIRVLDRYHIRSDIKTMDGAPHTFCFFEPWFTPMLEAMDIFLQDLFNNRK